jgi:hypothetical protein
MPVPVSCPTCGSKLQAPEKLSGRSVKCPKCGELLAIPAAAPQPPLPAMPADPPPRDEASAPYEAGPRRDRREDRASPPRAGRGIPRLVWLLGIPFGLLGLCCGGCLTLGLIGSASAQKALEEADRQYAAGKKDEAVAAYKQHFGSAKDKPEVLRRIVEHELEKGHTEEARDWVGRGVKQGVAVTYESAAARDLLARAQEERDAKAALAQAEREAKRQARKERKKEKPRGRVTRENYDRVRDGMTLAEVEALLGPGKEGASAGNVRVLTWQGGFLGRRIISISFQDDKVVGKAIVD